MKLVADTCSELEQQNLILEAINEALENMIYKSQKLESEHEKKELLQQNLFLEQINDFILDDNKKSIDNIFSIISHELRTPLVPIKVYVKMILEGKFGLVNQEQISKLEIIGKNILALEKIIESSIESKKIESGLVSLKLEKNDITQIFEDAAREFEKQLIERNIKLSVTQTKYFIICDYYLIRRLFTALIRNSITAMNHGGNIVLTIEQTDKETKIRIHDTGCGIPGEKIPQLFSKLHQVDMSNTREVVGLGMGLYFCKLVVDMHNGNISIQSKMGHGTTTLITFNH